MRINQIFQGITAAGLDADLREEVQEAIRRILKERRKLGLDNDVEDLYWSRDAVGRDLKIDRAVMDALWRIPSVASIVKSLEQAEDDEEEEEEDEDEEDGNEDGNEDDEEEGKEDDVEDEDGSNGDDEKEEEETLMHVMHAVNAVGHRVDDVHDDVRAIRGRVEHSGRFARALALHAIVIMLAVLMTHMYHVRIVGGSAGYLLPSPNVSMSHVWCKITSACQEFWRMSARVIAADL